MEQRPEPAGGRGGEDGPAPLAPAPRSVPIARGWMAERKMAARCAAASHVPGDIAERPPTLAESPTPQQMQSRVPLCRAEAHRGARAQLRKGVRTA